MKVRADLMPKTPGSRPRKEWSSGTAVGVTRCVEAVAETLGKSGKNPWTDDNRCLPAKFCRTPLARKRK